ncbi:hypothetical protein DOK67_0000649 [Enterococcus sp. DIV0212c]|uniref:DUF4767 domain-containing protein n=1 Tax=Enterococcus sp. DIV0212c TaxID=2230867 RepID=UPI001A9B77BA|nr:DUF4767 domain-containing protein [Enterococcus sp. DIV0212c]MBO1354701.1 DUF4767 domain-containing protein [Enterococcus sp. DIV0212c]
MKKILVGISSFLIIGLVAGCSNNKETSSTSSEATTTTTNDKKQAEYDSAMAKGKEAIVDKDMSKAKAAFQLALEYKKDSDEAKQLVEQVKSYQNIMTLKEEKEYTKALKELSVLVGAKKGSKTLKQYGQELTEEINKEIVKEREDSKKAPEKTKETNEKTEPSKAAAAPTPIPPVTETIVPWNLQKRLDLLAFMQSWGDVMGQSYIEYYPGFEANWYGYHFPSIFSRNNIAVGGNQAVLQWSENGTVSNVYNVVAIYSDIATTDKLERHLYLFTILNGQPIVLVTMQNQGNPENMIYFKQSQNADLNNGFAEIVGR